MNARKILVLAAVISMLAGCGAGVSGYSDGSRVGTVQKFSQKGLFWKTWEGEMAMEGVTVTQTDKGTSFKATWEFTVRDPALVPKFEEALASGSRAKVKYNQHIFTGPSWDSTYEVKSVELVK